MAKEYENLVDSIKEYNDAVLRKDKDLQVVIDNLISSQTSYSKWIYDNYNIVFPLILDNEEETLDNFEEEQTQNEDSLYEVVSDDANLNLETEDKQ